MINKDICLVGHLIKGDYTRQGVGGWSKIPILGEMSFMNVPLNLLDFYHKVHENMYVYGSDD